MRKLLISFIVSLSLLPIFAQMTLNLGEDTVFCAGLVTDTLFLGTNLIIMNGEEPYTFAWECTYELTPSLVLSASDFLNDSTLANPYFKNWPIGDVEYIRFYLHVMDDYGANAVDSINFGFTGCSCLVGEIVIEINPGDSVLLDAGIGPFGKYNKFFWVPNYGLSNPDSSTTWCKPEVTTSYSLVRVDTFGCECSCPAYEIRVKPEWIQETYLTKNNRFDIYQVDTRIYFYNPLRQEANIALYSLNGLKIQSFETKVDYFDIASILTKGIYIVCINVGEYTINSKIKIF